MSNIDILMASYNSEKYIENQINSILNQTYTNYHLYINDDLSTDNTLNILQKYKMQYNNQISIYQNPKNLGIKENFSALLKQSNASYIMFADHDDVWFEDKVEITYRKMVTLEKQFSSSTPILIFTDKMITDCNLNLIKSSHNKSEKLNVQNISFNRLLMSNIISGCTVMINKSLKEICRNVNKNAVMYDYWIALVAAAFGYIGYIDRPTMFYRQHDTNAFGAKSYFWKYALKMLKEGKMSMRQAVYKNIIQAENFYNQYEPMLSEHNKEILKEFISLKNKKHLSFINTIIKNNFYKSGFVRNIGLLFAFL